MSLPLMQVPEIKFKNFYRLFVFVEISFGPLGEQ